ncbi:hypothetical protein C9374_007581 [Naegleria lovaniensis]|uniref:Uncharacterized protein n=1 Tax=Naegleria lovaniensis TaxID=51637 RepID=A0AA88KIJ1_NAELO|nr:uncharacterized protein C9374_007581 [Naegleria lovaniensis]KAG2378943.1 hypothetical protein C9374_007581 [Naegleria lovaniensis]
MHLQPSLQVARSNSPNQNHQLETTRSTPIINSRLFEDERVSDSLIPILQIVVPHSDESTNTSSTNGHSKNAEKPAIPSRYSLTRVSSFTNRSFKDLKEVPTDLLPKIIEVSSRSPTPVSPVSPISPPRSYASSPIPSGNTLLPSPITRPAFTRTSSSSTNLSLSNSVPSTLIPKTQKPPNTFLTEVDDKKEIQIEIEDIDFRLDLLPHWLFDSSQQSIEQCKFPKDFATTCKFPRKKPLHPSFVIKQVLNIYFPSFLSDHAPSQSKIHVNQVLLSEQNQNILLDAFWWFYVKLFGHQYLVSKSTEYYMTNLDMCLEKIHHSNDFFLRLQKSKYYQEKAQEWSQRRFEALAQEFIQVENRIANNYAEMVVKFIAARQFESKHNISYGFDEMYIEVMAKSVFMSFGYNFPDSSEQFETAEFQRTIVTQFQIWSLGLDSIRQPCLDNVWKYKVELKLPTTSSDNCKLTVKQKFQKAVLTVCSGVKERTTVKKQQDELNHVLAKIEENTYSPRYNLFEMFHEEEMNFIELVKANRKAQIVEAFAQGANLTTEELAQIIEYDERDEELHFELKVLREAKQKHEKNHSPKSYDIKDVATVRKKAWYEIGEGDNVTLKSTTRKECKHLGVFKAYSHSKKSSPLVSQYVSLLRETNSLQRQAERFEKRNVMRRDYMKTPQPKNDDNSSLRKSLNNTNESSVLSNTSSSSYSKGYSTLLKPDKSIHKLFSQVV